MAEDIVKKPMCRRCSSAQKKNAFYDKINFLFHFMKLMNHKKVQADSFMEVT